MARTHIHTISTTYKQWPTEFIMPRGTSPPTLRCLVRAQRRHLLPSYPPSPSPTPSPPHSALTSPDKTLPSSPHSATRPPTSQAHTPTNEHAATSHPDEHTNPSFPALPPSRITTLPHGHNAFSAPPPPPSSSRYAKRIKTRRNPGLTLYPHTYPNRRTH
jgi:hypothetical protein